MDSPSLYTNLLTKGNAVFEGYAFYAGILVTKMLLMSFLTIIQRHRKKAFINPEDIPAGGEIKFNDEDVERVRRAHLNDLENIPVFLVTGLIYVISDPNVVFALMLFRLYTLARIIHTCVYGIYVVRQPARAICFLTGFGINIIMIICIWVSFPQL